MIAANYTMHLYCDCEECASHMWTTPTNILHIGETWADCAKEAKEDGWKISRDRTRAYAPGHSTK